MSLESLYHETNRQLGEVQGRMGELDRMTFQAAEGSTGIAERTGALQKEISVRIEQIIRNSERLDVLVQKEPAAGNRRLNAKVKVDQLKSDVRHVQSSFQSLKARQWQREREMRDRDQLLKMRFTTNEAAAKANATDSSTSVLIDRAIEHNDRLTRSNRAVDDLLGQGSVMLESLRNQRETIKGFRRKMIDVANVLGMSGTVMRLIERRQEGDKWVLYGGMIITCIIMYLVIRYFT